MLKVFFVTYHCTNTLDSVTRAVQNAKNSTLTELKF